MKITKNILGLLLCALTTTHLLCNTRNGALHDFDSDSDHELPVSPIYTAAIHQEELVAQLPQDTDDETETASQVERLLNAAKKDKNTEKLKNSRELMIIGVSFFALAQTLHMLTVPATSYYSDLKDDAALVSNALGSFAMLAGVIQYRFGKVYLEKIDTKK